MLAKCEVLVVGGGPSGLSAAISAARAGADTILCERFGCFGGVITTVGMETIAWYRYEGCVNDTEVRYVHTGPICKANNDLLDRQVSGRGREEVTHF